MNIIDNLINEERKSVLKIIANNEFEAILQRFKDLKFSDNLNEVEQNYTALEILKKLARWQEAEKSRMSQEALKEKMEKSKSKK